MAMAGAVIRNDLVRLLAERRWTDDMLAERAGVGRSHVTQLKNGRALPRVATALRIAGALGLTVEAVFPPGSSSRRRRGRRSNHPLRGDAPAATTSPR
jgi:transcriptional regulator with XRE-family HTH domain